MWWVGAPRFVGGELNACYNAVDRHVEAGKKDKVALIHDSPVTNVIRKVTYGELHEQVRITLPNGVTRFLPSSNPRRSVEVKLTFSDIQSKNKSAE